MPRISTLDESNASQDAKAVLDQVRSKFGGVPNLLATMAHSPAALRSYLAFGDAISGSSLSAGFREQLAVAIAGANACEYCASAHTAIGKGAGVAADELERNLAGESDDVRTQAGINLARAIVTKRGLISDDDLASARGAGFNDTEITEIIAVVALNIFTNYFNHVAETVNDFPRVEVPAPAGA